MPVTVSYQPPRPLAPLRLDSSCIARQDIESPPGQVRRAPGRVHTPSSSVPTTPVISAAPASPEKQLRHPGQSNAFLTELAAQERRVLELKEELQKAEADLECLKKRWASHEASKKRNELRQLEQMQILTSSLSGRGQDRLADQASMHLDTEKQAMAPPTFKPAQRTVFSGSRHTRTLSLLSSKEPIADYDYPVRHDHRARSRRDTANGHKSSPIPELGSSKDGPCDVDMKSRDPPKDLLIETGKQLVGDFRNGLWTFFEDLKQVTVGDEAMNIKDQRSQNSLPVKKLSKGQLQKDKAVNGQKRFSLQSNHVRVHAHTRKLPTNTSTILSADEDMCVKDSSLGHPAPAEHNFAVSNDITHGETDDEGWDDWHATTSTESTPGKDNALSPITDTMSSRTSIR